MLRDVDFKPFYSSGSDDEPSGFLFDGLCNSLNLDLGLGYFRSTGFSCLALGFATFLKNGGTMRFIINDSLAEKDKIAILQGYESKSDEEYEKSLLSDLNTLTRTLTKRNIHFFNCLSWLISSDRLQMIAVVPKKNKVGIVHHKFGIFTDENDDQTVFNGSLNFSQYALQYNIESIWCEYSWETQGFARRRIDEMKRLFENTWNGNSTVVRVIEIEKVKTAIYTKFPKKSIKELVEMECELAKEVIEYPGNTEEYKKKVKSIIKKLELESEVTPTKKNSEPVKKWAHQDEAISLFMKSERGVLNMATGTGKTKTSLRICKKLIEQNAIDTIIISCDGTDLLFQWYKELLKLIANEKLQWLVIKQFSSFHESEKFRNNPFHKILLTSRLQLDTSITKFNLETGKRTLLIHDEVHKLGSAGNRDRLQSLSDHFRYRLGLSATPEREYDEEGTQFILNQVGPVIFEFSLEDAIKRGILAPFNYYPINYDLTDNDKLRLQNVHKRKAARQKEGKPMADEEFWNELAKVYKTAEGKIPAFREFISSQSDMLENCIIFVETKEYGQEILEIVHEYHPDFHTYYSEDDSNVLLRFSSGEIDCLLTCHRLSEGIDIQSLKNVILFSSSRAKLETIQRIGRCLRSDPNNPKKIANIVDFIRDHDNDSIRSADDERRDYLTNLSLIKP